ncbi:hypothetical protein EDD11_000211 [Mortierella claussenii]|nr:hypothetical protein EDD11_000211 [Mortierella claussenii]
MPNRRRKRHSYQQTATLTVEQPSPWSVAPAPVVDHSSQLVRSHTSADLKPVGTKDRTAALHQNQHQRQEQTQIQSNSRPDPAYSSIAALYQNAGSASASPSSSSNTDSECDVGDVEQAVLDQAQHSTDPIPVPLVTSESHHLQKPFPQTKAALQPVNLPRRYTSFSSAKPTRSMTNTSLSSNSSHNSSLSTMSSVSSADSTAMRLVDSSMSIRSQMSSESSSTLLSAAIAASGLPSMDKMMDQVDRSIATDSQAQWVENVHVGLVAQVSFVDTQLIVEPCSATVETWVN